MDDTTVKIEEVDCLECGGMCCKASRKCGENPYGVTPWKKIERNEEFLLKSFPPEKVKQELDLWNKDNITHESAPCFNLLPDGLCLIHKEYGWDAKPQLCKDFVAGCEECLRIKGDV